MEENNKGMSLEAWHAMCKKHYGDRYSEEIVRDENTYVTFLKRAITPEQEEQLKPYKADSLKYITLKRFMIAGNTLERSIELFEEQEKYL